MKAVTEATREREDLESDTKRHEDVNLGRRSTRGWEGAQKVEGQRKTIAVVGALVS